MPAAFVSPGFSTVKAYWQDTRNVDSQLGGETQPILEPDSV